MKKSIHKEKPFSVCLDGYPEQFAYILLAHMVAAGLKEIRVASADIQAADDLAATGRIVVCFDGTEDAGTLTVRIRDEASA